MEISSFDWKDFLCYFFFLIRHILNYECSNGNRPLIDTPVHMMCVLSVKLGFAILVVMTT